MTLPPPARVSPNNSAFAVTVMGRPLPAQRGLRHESSRLWSCDCKRYRMSMRQYLPSSNTNASMQRNVDRSSSAMFGSYGLIAAILLLGGAGFVLDRWLGTEPWLLVAGLLVGAAIGLYQLGSRALRS